MILVALLGALALWIGAAMLIAVVPAWLVMLALGMTGHHVSFVLCFVVGTLVFLPFCRAHVTIRN